MPTKADFGLAAHFGMTASVLDVARRVGFGAQVVESKDGYSTSF
jgi:hypothetical protein